MTSVHVHTHGLESILAGGPFYLGCNHSPCPLHGVGEQRHTVDNDKLSVVTGSEGKSVDAAKALHLGQFGGKNVLYANRIDELQCHAVPPEPMIPAGSGCAYGEGKSSAYTSSSNKPINIWAPLFLGVRQIGAAS